MTARTRSPSGWSAGSLNCKIPQKWSRPFTLCDLSRSLRFPYAENGIHVQRLFSNFADGWPGAGLLIQRLLIGAASLYWVAATRDGTVAALKVIGVLAGLLLIAGL